MTPYLLNHLLAHAVAGAPAKAAIVDQTKSVSYAALDEISNQLANTLREHGVRKGDRIGIYIDKSVEAVISIFAILKAGATYVPIDPRLPVKRAAFVTDDCGIRGLVTTPERFARLRSHLSSAPACVIAIGDGVRGSAVAWREVLRARKDPPADPHLIEVDLAYILYTSGSTGEPKGVTISHRAALSFVNWAIDYFEIAPSDVLSNHAPLHFDLSVFDLFVAVAVGATVALVPPAISIFPRDLADWIERSCITVWYSVPSALTQLALHGDLERHAYSRLRYVVFAGEVFPVPHLRRLVERIPHAAYYNLYGPTETNVCAAYALPAGVPIEDSPIPIGRACANTEIFALDDNGQSPEPGRTGELYVRGPSLMSGYWGRAEQTRATLVANPLQPTSLERVYRTGDLVRVDDAGIYHFVGRRDLQVKSRGYRIELGDIEAALYRHDAVAEAAVIAVPHDEFGCTLRGIVVARENHALSRDELSAFCAQQLPGYMIPTEFEFRGALPKTSNGKIDRAALRNTV